MDPVPRPDVGLLQDYIISPRREQDGRFVNPGAMIYARVHDHTVAED